MGLYVNQNQNRSELQQRLDAELRAKAAARSKEEISSSDGVNDSAYLEGTKSTTRFDLGWVIIAVLVCALTTVFIWMLAG